MICEYCPLSDPEDVCPENEGKYGYVTSDGRKWRERRMDKLKPCPFCGGETVVSGHHNRFTEWYLCSCPKCHISQTSSEYSFRYEAIEAWNRRVNDG